MQGLLLSVKKHIIFLFLLILLVFLLWIRLFVVPKSNQEAQNITPTPFITSVVTPPVQIIEQTQTQITPAVNVNLEGGIRYTFSGSPITIPSQLPVFNYQNRLNLTKDNAQKLALLFSFTGEPFIEDVNSDGAPFYTWKNQQETFMMGGSYPYLNYIKNNPQIVGFENPLNQEQLTTKSVEAIEKIGITNFDKNNPQITYYTVTPYAPSINEYILEETTNPESASYVKFTYQLNIKTYPLVSQEYKNSTLYVILDKNGEVFELFSYIIPETSSTTIKTKSFSDIVDNLNSEAIVFSASSSLDINSEAEETYSISQVDLTNPKIVYYLPQNFSYSLYPYLMFSGKSFDSNLNQEVDVLILAPFN